MTKNKKVMVLGISALMALGAISVIGTQGIKSAFGGNEVVWKHYKSIAPTKTEKGIKEYWVNCDDNSHVFTEPTGAGVTIQEGEWNDTKKADVIALNDDRILAAGDWKAFVYQSVSNANQLFGGERISNMAMDAENEKFTFRVGQESGGVFNEEEHTYTPDSKAPSANRGSFKLQAPLLKVANDFGFRYVVVTIKANSALADYNYLCNRFAYTSEGSVAWNACWKQSNGTAPMEDGFTFCFDTTCFGGFVDTHADDYYLVHLRNSSCPDYDSVVADVTISNIGFSNADCFQNDEQYREAVTYEVNDDGIPTHALVRSYETSSGGFATTTGLTEAYFQMVAAQGIKSGSIGLTWSDNDGNMYYNKKINAAGTATENFSRIGSFQFEPSQMKNFFVGLTLSMGAYNKPGTIDMVFSYKDYVAADLYERPFNQDNLDSLYGFDPALHGVTVTGGAAGNGGVGNSVLTNGASAYVYSNGTVKSTDAGTLTLRYFALALHINKYTPSLGDVVVFNPGTYSDPENKWNVNRTCTLTEAVVFAYNGVDFVNVTTAEEAKWALGNIWNGKTVTTSGLAGVAALMNIAGYTKLYFHAEIASLYPNACGEEGFTDYRLIPTVVGTTGSATKNFYGYQKNGIGASGADIAINFTSSLANAALSGCTSIQNITFTVRCWHASTQSLTGHNNEGSGCWKNLGANVQVSNVTFAE